MTGRDDDEALTWSGEDDPTLEKGAGTSARPHIDSKPVAVPAKGSAEKSAGSTSTAAVPAGGKVPKPSEADAAPALPHGYNAVGKGSETVGRIEEDGSVTPAEKRPQMGNAMLVTLGIFGGAYILFTIGWLIGGLRFMDGEQVQVLVTPVAYQVSLWMAVLAAPIWFVTTFIATRKSKSWVRVMWLLIGLVLLVPWPFALIGALGQ